MAGSAVRGTTLPGGLPTLVVGRGRPLVVLRGLTAEHRNPAGAERVAELRLVRGYTDRFRVHLVTPRPGQPDGVTMRDLAVDVAAAIQDGFEDPVPVVGISTGGSIAQQLAIDHPRSVTRLVLVATASRLGPAGREAQRRLAALTAAGRPRAAWAATAPILAGGPLGRVGWAALQWLTAPWQAPADPSDLLAMLRAEDAFDATDELHRIVAPTLVVGGGRDGCYGVGRFRETARRIPDARLVLYPHRSHASVPGLAAAQRRVVRFLTADLPARPRTGVAVDP